MLIIHKYQSLLLITHRKCDSFSLTPEEFGATLLVPERAVRSPASANQSQTTIHAGSPEPAARRRRRKAGAALPPRSLQSPHPPIQKNLRPASPVGGVHLRCCELRLGGAPQPRGRKAAATEAPSITSLPPLRGRPAMGTSRLRRKGGAGGINPRKYVRSLQG